MNFKKVALLVVLAGLIIAGIVGYSYYNKIFKTAVKDQTSVFIPSNATFNEVVEILEPHIKDKSNFEWVAHKKNYHNKIKGGHYTLKKGINNNELVDLLRSGSQTPVKVAFNNQDTPEKLAGRIAQQIEPDSVAILKAITNNDFLAKNNLTKANLLKIFIPNSYEFYWTTSADKFADKMVKEHSKFWNKTRKNKAKKLGLTPDKVTTLASIVQKETAQASERPIVAGLYLNRLRDNWPLQADPTVIFALKQKNGQDFQVKRVLNKDLELDSPYNTYKNTGLPPALISMPDISSIDAVLNHAKHDYYYMCASTTKLGFHDFAKTLAQHNANAEKYRKWVSKQGINR